MQLNNEKTCLQSSEDKVAVLEKNAGRELNRSVKLFQISDMHDETGRYRDTTGGLISNNAGLSCYQAGI